MQSIDQLRHFTIFQDKIESKFKWNGYIHSDEIPNWIEQMNLNFSLTVAD